MNKIAIKPGNERHDTVKTSLPTKLSCDRITAPPLVMWTILSLLLIIPSLPARAQGVIHLGPGDSSLFSNLIGHAIYNNEGGLPLTYLEVNVFFGVDLFEPGDSYQVDAFFPPTAAIPMATAVNNTSSELHNSSTAWGGVAWPLGQPGAIRITMLTGSVDVRFVQVISFNNSTYYDVDYFLAPEPNASLLVAVGVGLFGGARRLKHRKR